MIPSPENTLPWMCIVNPNAGLKKAQRDWPVIESLLKKHQIAYQHRFTIERMHAVTLTRDALTAGFRKFLVVGGDGTLNEVLNGIMMQDIIPTADCTLAMIPVGSGNDWCRTHAIPFSYPDAVRIVAGGHIFIHDVARVNYRHHDTDQTRYLINMAGMGYDAMVASRTNDMKDKGKGGAFLYIYNLLTSLFKYRYANARVMIDEREHEFKLFSMNVGICMYNGAGMKQLPDAVPDDGLLDITVIRKISRLAVIRHTPRLYDGSFIKLPQVLTFRGKKVLVTASPAISLEADGESLGHSPFVFDIVPQAVKIITGRTDYQSN
ncbi:MAG TPA: diacylglycerol kinase family lipid kinase [Bacteroidales bacterium]|nr:diacylglycerol kinase family lipid kinase [Bacteroidales bacterium]HSA42174.1 diacylglycerol kinase family lipid kinase [Bacteroidales bacterium]